MADIIYDTPDEEITMSLENEFDAVDSFLLVQEILAYRKAFLKLKAESERLKEITKRLLEAYCNMTQTLHSESEFFGDQLTQEAERALKAGE